MIIVFALVGQRRLEGFSGVGGVGGGFVQQTGVILRPRPPAGLGIVVLGNGGGIRPQGLIRLFLDMKNAAPPIGSLGALVAGGGNVVLDPRAG